MSYFKRTIAIFIAFVLIVITSYGLVSLQKTFSLATGYYNEVTCTKSKCTLNYYDNDTDELTTYDNVAKYYDIEPYQEYPYKGEYKYFYKENEVTYDEFVTGKEDYYAEQTLKQYGSSAKRVHTADDIIKQYDNVFKNNKVGEFKLVITPTEAKKVDWDKVDNYIKGRYVVKEFNQNYYPYSEKGEWEPDRVYVSPKDFISSGTNVGTLTLDTRESMRTTGDEKKVVESFTSKLLPLLQGDGSDYQKILAAYTYITKTTSYLVDDGYVTFLATNTSPYDTLINRKSVCIGYSITFSYLMDKLGVESYIVDVFSNDDSGFQSTHTYNIVKLEGKWYKIDTTGGVFLASVSKSELYDGGPGTLASSSYNTSGKLKTYTLDYTKINTYLAEAKKISTTTTKTIQATTKATTTKPSAPYVTTKKSSSNKSTTAKNNNKATTATTNTTISLNDIDVYRYYNKYIYYFDSNNNSLKLSEDEFKKKYNNIWTLIENGTYEFDGDGYLIKDNSTTTVTTSINDTTTMISPKEEESTTITSTKTTKAIETNDSKKIGNIILFSLVGVILFGFIIYEILIHKKNV